ncbi:hypothetical protein B0T19DRAFT_57719 [Cercophora scortea]|uniref:Uncharacterized protein n=1 Tax=Cercophora scortea TaxID=314031 RepID=A0AAE0J4V1_9PEZI|nr:hypothetical protein B0T19DRAFT_57719 [Cercophora scortea]
MTKRLSSARWCSESMASLRRTRAAKVSGVDEHLLGSFFPNTSEVFWREFSKHFRSDTPPSWENIKDAFVKARGKRQSTSQSGISRKNDWQPKDTESAAQILRDQAKAPPEPSDNDEPANLTDVVDLTSQPEPTCDDDSAPESRRGASCSLSNATTSVLQSHKSTFAIQGNSLQTLQPGQRLNDEIVNGALRLIKEASHNNVQVIDSLALRGGQLAARIDFRSTKVLLPMLIRNNHWVLGAYEASA